MATLLDIKNIVCMVFAKFKKLAYCSSIEEFYLLLIEFLDITGEVGNIVLDKIPYEKWANPYFSGNNYGAICLTLAESLTIGLCIIEVCQVFSLYSLILYFYSIF